MEPRYQLFVPVHVLDELIDLWIALPSEDRRREDIPARFHEIKDPLARDPIAGLAGVTPFLRIIERPPLRVEYEVSVKDRRIIVSGVEMC